ncbi:MAG: hypothetical protein M3251_04110 [Thermoproteota archaeon]|nr:hypothetical protein [Thermoproteota archaeon]
MMRIAEALKKEHPDKKEYWQNELKSLGIVEPDHLLQNQLDDSEEELQELADSIKSVYFQAYKAAYSSSSINGNNNNNNNNSESRLADSQTPQNRE